ncbi:glycosyltransferase family 39 protein [Nostocaceae cyanobacterium CENA369]|uniref:Glycosyltransferase family 39 protein n=1 Tax=Dendronalium phyllosphericum CENA369 TaxID=1725256 RepID=A0A8J7LLX1_9NOST|nr:glycosyltransferase family 39 protein [Dendronalium phyllosphericum]MBH8576804.1 glycosyltransferase family 39 protein [Dendronalium phyllosphericum CENA369]
MKNRRLTLHYLGLAGAIALGAVLRFWHLDLKPLWMDEVITAIFSLGKNYHDLPFNVVFPLDRVQDIFTFQPGVSCNQIAENVAIQSTHPPLFFCVMYNWLGLMTPLGTEWVAKLRSLPALFGVGAIAAIYGVNRIAFSKASGIIAALLMAVSPFAVYLSQEARHYTMPMFLITLALLGLMQIQRDIVERTQPRFWVWILWTIINSIALYIHYFFALAFIAEIATIIVLMYWGKAKIQNKRQIWFALIISTSSVLVSFIPWLLVILSHFQRSETNWLPSPTHIAPLYQTLISWVLMAIALPVENQPLLIVVISGLLMLIFAIWAGRQIFKGLKNLWAQDKTHLATLTLLSFTAFVLLQFFAIVYILGKDITVVPRYTFVYYPSFCALLAASISKINRSSIIFILVGFISCIFVVSNLVFQKPFQPEKVAQNMNLEPYASLTLVVAYSNYQDVALGFSFALALEQLRSQTPVGELKINKTDKSARLNSDSFAVLQKSPDLSAFWKNFSQLRLPTTSKQNLWIVGPGLRKRDYPQQIALSGQTTCNIDPTQHYRIGVPYQLYRCSNSR